MSDVVKGGERLFSPPSPLIWSHDVVISAGIDDYKRGLVKFMAVKVISGLNHDDGQSPEIV